MIRSVCYKCGNPNTPDCSIFRCRTTNTFQPVFYSSCADCDTDCYVDSVDLFYNNHISLITFEFFQKVKNSREKM